jgi:malate dehydrogenase
MSIVAIIGAGPLGGALAHALAARSRVAEIRMIDPQGRVAEGKALDIQQSGPIEQFSARLTSAAALTAAAGADAIVLADLLPATDPPTQGGEISGEAGLALLRQVARFDTTAPLLFAGGSQRELMGRAVDELHLEPSRLVGSAPLALESAIRGVTAALLDASPMDLSIGVAGVPPRDGVIGWDAATAFHQPLAAVLAPHHLSSISSRLPALWPPPPYTLAAAAARVAEALVNGARRRYTCFAAVDVAGAGRGIIAAVPVEIVKGRVGRTLEPALSRHERTAFENGLR